MDLKKQDKILIEKSIESLKKDKNTNFLDQREINLITSFLNKGKIDYKIYYPYEESNYGIIYKNTFPKVCLLKINTNNILRHQDIMGSLYGLNINKNLFGDILIKDNYYILVMDHMSDYIINNLTSISKYNVTLEKTDISVTKNYIPNYQIIRFSVNSSRIDLVISKLINKSRNDIINLINKKEIILNYDVLSKKDYFLKENDVFSVHRYGKYKFEGIIKNTKKNKLIIEIKKYL